MAFRYKKGALRVSAVLSFLWISFLVAKIFEWRAHGDPSEAEQVAIFFAAYALAGTAALFLCVYVVDWVFKGFKPERD